MVSKVGTRTLVTDHQPKPLFFQILAAVEEFDAEGYTVDQIGPDKFLATLPK